jgi:hypothetical protein
MFPIQCTEGYNSELTKMDPYIRRGVHLRTVDTSMDLAFRKKEICLFTYLS